ncbi:hypothetical protein M0804_014780 [Polistes exclamans]|nr:hypothetical protein M0804_014782 [Polistes exclamans]KAI4474572.1 hypothetical protein M0804_014780 [Polistes exclamans]
MPPPPPSPPRPEEEDEDEDEDEEVKVSSVHEHDKDDDKVVEKEDGEVVVKGGEGGKGEKEILLTNILPRNPR